tara:strand:- start:2212 stop:2793 length:582 start_codon:yes stop_codon:yes gene_type:complete
MEPVYPDSDDTIFVYIDLAFSTTSCLLDNSSVQLSGNDISVSSQYCLGMATAICNTTDTIVIMPLPAAVNYNFNYYLSVGSLPLPCTPGVVPNDTFFFDFGVLEGSVGIDEKSVFSYGLRPNPSAGVFELYLPSYVEDDFSYLIVNNQGEHIKFGIVESNVHRFELPLKSGMYHMILSSKSSGYQVAERIVIY